MTTSMPTLAAVLLCVTAPLTLSPLARAAGSAEAGAAKAAVCTACHGPNGNSSNPEWPSLAGQNAAYISEQLHLFHDGKRVNPVMSAQAVSLSDEDIADVSAYFAAQVPSGLEADPSYWKAGEKLYRGGDRARSIPACKACHGPVGRGNPGAAYPALRAQHSVYTMKQLGDYASQARYRDANGKLQNPPNAHIMEAIAHRLTPEDIRDVASYIQGMR